MCHWTRPRVGTPSCCSSGPASRWALHLFVGLFTWSLGSSPGCCVSLLVLPLCCWALRLVVGLIAYPLALHFLDQPAASSTGPSSRRLAHHLVDQPTVLSIGMLFR